MEVLVYLAMVVLVAPYVLMAKAAMKIRSEYLKNQAETPLDLPKTL